MKKVNVIVLLLWGVVVGGALLTQQCRPGERPPVAPAAAPAYVGDQACRRCHAQQYKDWLTSDHFKAMQPANDSTVEGDFADASYTADGVTTKFFKKAGKYFIRTKGDDNANHDYMIQYTFGYNPLQEYLIAMPGGRLQVARQCWDVKKKKWFHQYAGQKIPAHDWLSWTGNAQNWNTTCAACHSTNLKKNYDPGTDTYHTTFSVLTVSCESCHGPGGMHISYINGDAYRRGQRVKHAYLQMAGGAGPTAQINTCAPCHSRRTEISAEKTGSSEFLDDYIPEIPTSEFYFPDGQAKEEDYVYTSFLESKMFARGVVCSNCHNPHSGQLLFTGNRLCLQCHGATYNSFSHTFHQAGSEGSECRSCHMPARTYMGNDLRFDHTFRTPRPDLSVKYGVPNTCNSCHKDRSAVWASNAVIKWYGPNRARHFSEDLIPASKGDSSSEAHILRLVNDTATPAIVKAAALYYAKDVRTDNSAAILIASLQSGNARIRYQALRSLAGFPPEIWLSAAGPALSDKVRAVRIAAADLYISVPPERVPSVYSGAFASAKTELEQYFLYQTDFSQGDAMAGDFYLKLHDYYDAERFYQLGLKKDTALNEARLNLAVIYNIKGDNAGALQLLQQALLTDPRNDRVYFNMALLYNEMHDRQQAERCLAKAIDLHTRNPRVYYNLGLMLQDEHKPGQAIAVFREGLQLSPGDEDLNYALCVLYIQNGQPEKARPYAGILRQHDPDNPNYQNLFKIPGL
ncbi:MAG TPA: tetratricopeptide repeat protein [Puia sp.]|nr:tetratricopeptide repeat protein [Puia sp.]